MVSTSTQDICETDDRTAEKALDLVYEQIKTKTIPKAMDILWPHILGAAQAGNTFLYDPIGRVNATLHLNPLAIQCLRNHLENKGFKFERQGDSANWMMPLSEDEGKEVLSWADAYELRK